MMDRKLFIVMIGMMTLCYSQGSRAQTTADSWPEAIKDSIVHVATTAYGYNSREPWKHEGLSDIWSCASAVGPYQVLSTAYSLANHTDLKVLRYGQNEFIPAVVKVIDYESDLCLIELDRDKLREPLTPLVFADEGPQDGEVTFHWLSPDSRLYNGRGHFDRAHVQRVRTSFGPRLRYAIANISQRLGRGEVYCVGRMPIGIGCWADEDKEADLIPGQTINRFLNAATAGSTYHGFGELGFATSELRDPAVRSFLKMPESLRNGVYVDDVYTLGTGSDILKNRDVILNVAGHTIDAQGRYVDPVYGALSFEHLITSRPAGEDMAMVLWRAGRRVEISVQIKGFKSDQMLVPFQEYDLQPEYIIVGGFLFQKLTREYLLEFGDDPSGKAPSHLYYYFRSQGFKPTEQRKDIVMLSYVIPTQTNQGYTSLGRLVVSKVNGMAIGSIEDISQAMELNPDSDYHVVEFELDGPTVVIPRRPLATVDAFITQNYGIRQLSNVRP